jgi:glycosyltransferase involved in cell wall biosynthesis
MGSVAVDVVMTVHNGAAYLQAAVESIFHQQFTGWTLHVVDDASNDETGAILEDIRHPRVRVYRLLHNAGPYEAARVALMECRAPLVARMDADDLSHPARLSSQVAYLEAHPGVALLGTGYRRVDGTGVDLGLAAAPADEAAVRCAALLGNPLLHSSVMFRREAFAQHGLAYRRDWRVAADYDLWSRALAVVGVSVLAEPLVTYRVREDSISSVHADIQWQRHDEVACRTVRTLLPEGPPDDAIRALRGALHRGEGGSAPQATLDALWAACVKRGWDSTGARAWYRQQCRRLEGHPV